MNKTPVVLSLVVVAALIIGCGAVAEPSASEQTSQAPATATAEPTESPTPAVETTAPEPTVEATTEPTAPAEPAAETRQAEPAPDPRLGLVVTPMEEWGDAVITAYPGDTFTIVGDGYQPGEQLRVGFGPAQTDSSIIGDPFTFADANGSFIYVITLPLEIEIRNFVATISTPDFQNRLNVTVEVLEP